MSDWWVNFQDKLAEYPTWIVIGGAAIVLACMFMLLGRILRVLGVLMFFALGAAGIWYAWQQLTGDPPETQPAPQTAPPLRLQPEPANPPPANPTP